MKDYFEIQDGVYEIEDIKPHEKIFHSLYAYFNVDSPKRLAGIIFLPALLVSIFLTVSIFIHPTRNGYRAFQSIFSSILFYLVLFILGRKMISQNRPKQYLKIVDSYIELIDVNLNKIQGYNLERNQPNVKRFIICGRLVFLILKSSKRPRGHGHGAIINDAIAIPQRCLEHPITDTSILEKINENEVARTQERSKIESNLYIEETLKGHIKKLLLFRITGSILLILSIGSRMIDFNRISNHTLMVFMVVGVFMGGLILGLILFIASFLKRKRRDFIIGNDGILIKYVHLNVRDQRIKWAEVDSVLDKGNRIIIEYTPKEYLDKFYPTTIAINKEDFDLSDFNDMKNILTR